MKIWFYLLSLTVVIYGVGLARAQEHSTDSKKQTVKRKGKHSSDKETDGTQAPNRFEADTVIQSQYELNGEHLEVDPD